MSLVAAGDAVGALAEFALEKGVDVKTAAGIDELMQGEAGLEQAAIDMGLDPQAVMGALIAHTNSRGTK